jgi:glutaminase
MGEVKMRSRQMDRLFVRASISSRLLVGLVLLAAPWASGRAQVAPAMQQSANDIQGVLNATYEKYKSLREGKNADYIPVLAKVDPNIFGIVLITPDGKVYAVGDTSSRVSIQSISKVFTLARILEDSGETVVRKRIGVDATGRPFNSIYPVEEHKGKDMNSFVNAGAIATTSMINGATADEIWSKIMATHNDFAGRALSVDQPVYKSEAETNQRNRAIAALMYAYGTITADPLQSTDLYTKQCAIAVNAKDLAVMAATLAANGKNPVTGKQVIDAKHVAPLLAVMATAGLYDNSGEWLYATGLPAKSGVGGGLIAVSPGKFGIAVVSPPLDSAGNSVRGQKAIADISGALGGNPYAVRRW